MRNKITNYIKIILSFLAGLLKRPSRLKKSVCASKELYCDKDSFKVISSSSVVLHVVTSELDGYFFECRKHTNIKKYVKSFIDDYFNIFCDDYPEKDADKEFIFKSLQNPQNFKKFISMGRKLYNLKSGCMEFLNTGNGAAIGLETTESELIKRLQKFVGEYAWCQLNSFYTNKYIGKNAFQNKEAAAALATYEISKLLGLEYMLPQANYITLNIDNKKSLFGLFIKTAEGCSILPFNSDERKGKITPLLQRDLSSLNVLDVITHEQDHSPNNYNVVMDENGLVTGVSAFDNKGEGTFFLSESLDFQTFKYCSSFIKPDGLINRPYISKELFEQIKQITPEMLFKKLKGILNPLQIFFCWKRINNLTTTIEKTLTKQNKFLLLSTTDWSEKTVEDELSGDYGKTYLISFFSDVFLY